MARLALHRRDVTGLVYDMAPHGMPGSMGCLAIYLCNIADPVPYLIDYKGVRRPVQLQTVEASKNKTGELSFSFTLRSYAK